MKEQETDKIMAFDMLFTNNQIQMYKILLSYLKPAVQKNFAIYIKLMELQYTISFFKNYPIAALDGLHHEDSVSTSQLFEEVLPFCSDSQKKQLNRIRGILQNFESMQEMMETIQMMKDLFPEGSNFGEGNEGGMDMAQLFSMLGSGDLSNMFN